MSAYPLNLRDLEVAPSSSRVAEELLAAASRELDRQRDAILSRDLSGLRRSFENLALLLGELETLRDVTAPLAPAARAVRERIAVNRALLWNGQASVDQFVNCISEAAEIPADTLFLSEVV